MVATRMAYSDKVILTSGSRFRNSGYFEPSYN